MKICFFSTKPYDKSHFDKFAKSYHIQYFEASLNTKTVHLIQDDDVEAVCIFVNDRLDQDCIEKLAQKNIKTIALRCAGFNNVDLNACEKYGIQVVRVPQYSPHAVAEHTMALLLALNRKIYKAYNRIREGNFSLVGLEGFDLYKKNIGIIGLGHIGQVFAEICHGFGCHVLGYDPNVNQLEHVKLLTLDELFKKSDVISLHCPLNEATHHLINQNNIKKMKEKVILINTGRGALIETQALIDGLKSQKIGAVGLDVYEQESSLFFSDHSMEIIQDDLLMRLVTFPNVLITSHQAFFTHEALDEIARVTIQNLQMLKHGKNCPNLVAHISRN